MQLVPSIFSLFLLCSPLAVVANVFEDLDVTVKSVVDENPAVAPLAGVILEFQLDGNFDAGEFTSNLNRTMTIFQNDIKRKANKMSIKRKVNDYAAYLVGNQTFHQWVDHVICVHPYSCVTKYVDEKYQCERVRCDVALAYAHMTAQAAQFNMLQAMDGYFSLGTHSMTEEMSYIGPFPKNVTVGMRFNGIPDVAMNENQTKIFEMALSDLMVSEYSTERYWFSMASSNVRNVRIGEKGADMRLDVELLSLHGSRPKRSYDDEVRAFLDGAKRAFVAMLLASGDPYFENWRGRRGLTMTIEKDDNSVYQRSAVGSKVATGSNEDVVLFQEMSYSLVIGIISIFVSTIFLALIYTLHEKNLLSDTKIANNNKNVVELDTSDDLDLELDLYEGNCVVTVDNSVKDYVKSITSETSLNNEVLTGDGIISLSGDDLTGDGIISLSSDDLTGDGIISLSDDDLSGDEKA